MKFSAIGISFLFLLLMGSDAFAQNKAPLPYHSKDSSVGVVNCANSLCHGSITEWKDSNVLQNEYITWSRFDKHARAYDILLNDKSKSIARKFGLGVPANKAKLCLDCHAHNVPEANRGDRFKLSDGVTCEACHGPAGRWLSSHVEPGATHAMNIQQGLYPTSKPMERAQLCLSCHFGNKDKFVSHRLMGAGHPRMSFELETFSTISPAHVRIDKDYEKRKQVWDGVKVWAIGQSLAVAETMDILRDPKRGRDGLFPELVLFDCHACHRPMSEQRWKPTTAFGASPGTGLARLNDSGMLMMRAIAKQMDPKLGARVTAQGGKLHRAVAGQGDAMAEAAAMKRLSLEVASRIENYSFSESALRGIAIGLIDDGANGYYRDYAGAEQAAMAIGSVVNFMNKRGMIKSAKPVNASLQKLYASLSNDEKYRPAEFQQRLREFKTVLLAQ
ncbi:MAG: multiheme c-type cytochrome [Arenimonas sp.]